MFWGHPETMRLRISYDFYHLPYVHQLTDLIFMYQNS